MANYEGGSVELKIQSTADQAAQALNRLMAAVRGVRGEIASFDKQFDNVSKSVNRLANGMKILEKLNIGKVNVQIDQVSKSLGSMSANLAKVDLSGFNVQSDNAAQALNRLTNSFRQLERLKNIDTRRAYTDLDRLGRVSSAGIEKMAQSLQGVELGKIQGAGAAINQLTNSLFKLQGLKLAPDITGNLKSQFDLLIPTLNDFINKLSGIRADGLKDILKALRDMPRAMERMQALDLSRLGEVFSNLSQQILPFLAQLKEASAELQAFATISKNLGGHGGAANLNLPTAKGLGGVNLLSSIFTGVKAGISNFLSGIGRIGNSLNSLRENVFKTNKSFLSMLNVGKLYFLFNYFKRMGQSFAQMLTKAIDFIEVENLFSRAMGTAREEAYRFATTMSETFGLALPDLMKAQAIFENILTSLGGINEEMGQILSQSLTKMAVDFSALYNISVEDAITKIEAALVGQTKPIRSVSGMDITVATLQTYLTQLGIVDRTVRQLSEVEKRLLRIYAIQEQLKASGAMGAWAQEIENPANQLKILSEQLQEIGRWISAVFVGVISKALPYINGFVMAIKELVKALAFFVGYEMPFTENIPDLLDTDGATDGLGDVEDALRDVKNASTGIDELNILAPPEAAVATQTGIDPRLLDALTEYDNLMEGIRMKAMDIRDAILDWFKFIQSLSWEELAEYARGLGEQLANYLNNIVAGVDWYEIGENIGSGINVLLNLIYGFLTKFKWQELGEAFANLLHGMIDRIDWDLLGKTIGAYWNAVIDIFYGFVTKFPWAKFGIALGTAINSFFAEVNWSKLGETLSEGIKGILTSLRKAIQTINWRQIGEDIKSFILAIDWAGIMREVVGLIGDILSAVTDLLVGLTSEGTAAALLTFATIIGGVILALKGFEFVNSIIKSVDDFEKSLLALANRMLYADGLTGKLGEALLRLHNNLGAIVGGAALAAGGLFLLIQNVVDLIMNFEELSGLQIAIKAALAAVGAAMLYLGTQAVIAGTGIAAGLAIGTAGLSLIVTAVIAAGVAIAAFVVKIASEEPAIKSTQKAAEDLAQAHKDLDDATKSLTNTTQSYVNSLDNAEEAQRKLDKIQRETGSSGENLHKQVMRNKDAYKGFSDTQKEVYKAYLNNLDAQEKLTKSTKDMDKASQEFTKAQQNQTKAHWDNQLALAAEEKNFDKYKAAVVDAFNKGELSAKQAQDAISKAMTGMSASARKTFVEDLPSQLQQGLDPKKFETTWQKLLNGWKNFWGIASPSKVMQEQANFLMDGLLVGFENSRQRVLSFFSNMGSSISSTLRSSINSALDWVQSGINSAISSVNSLVSKVNSAVSSSVSKIQSVTVPKFADGGFPDKGMFAFNEGASVELVGNINGRTAVVNNDQIVAAVSRGVAQAVASVLSSQAQRPRQPVEVTSVLQVGARELARATNQAVVDMGANQLEGVFANA